MADCRTYFFCKIWQWNSTNLRIEAKSGHLNFSVQILHDIYYGFNCDIEQIDMYDWTFIHGRQLHVTLSPLGYLPWKSFMNWINICIIFCVYLCYSINNGTCIAFCAHSIVHKMCIIFVYIQLIMYFVCTQLSMTPVIQFDFFITEIQQHLLILPLLHHQHCLEEHESWMIMFSLVLQVIHNHLHLILLTGLYFTISHFSS